MKSTWYVVIAVVVVAVIVDLVVRARVRKARHERAARVLEQRQADIASAQGIIGYLQGATQLYRQAIHTVLRGDVDTLEAAHLVSSFQSCREDLGRTITISAIRCEIGVVRVTVQASNAVTDELVHRLKTEADAHQLRAGEFNYGGYLTFELSMATPAELAELRRRRHDFVKELKTSLCTEAGS